MPRYLRHPFRGQFLLPGQHFQLVRCDSAVIPAQRHKVGARFHRGYVYCHHAGNRT